MRRVWAWLGSPPARLALPVVALAVAIAIVASIALTGGSTPASDSLRASTPLPVSDEPTTSPAPEPTDTATPTPTATDSGSAVADPTVTPATTPSEPAFTADLFLPTAYLTATFGHGTSAVAQHLGDGSPGAFGVWGSCFNLGGTVAGDNPGSTPSDDNWSPVGTRSWHWAGPVMVAESIHRAPDVATATRLLDQCAEPRTQKWDPSPAGTTGSEVTLDGASGFVSREPSEDFTTYRSGARLGRDVIEVIWRQDGTVTSQAAAERLLDAAIRQHDGVDLPAAVPAPAPVEADGFASLPDTGDLWPDGRRDELNWLADRTSTDDFACATPDPGPSSVAWKDLDTTGVVVTRVWQSGWDNDPAIPPGVTIRRADAPDEQTAQQQFAGCRGTWHSVGIGDDSYYVDDGADVIDGSPLAAFFRVGRTYYFLSMGFTDPPELTRVANLVIAHGSTS